MFKTDSLTKEKHYKGNIKQLDKEHFRELYLKHYNEVFNHLYFCCNDHGLSSDLTQETFLKLWGQRSKIKDKNSLLPFLIRISHNLLNDHFRHQKVERKYADHKTSSGDRMENPESALHAKFLEDKIREVVMNHLTDKTRSIFIMSRYDGKSNDEISEMLGVAKKTIENRLHMALSVIRKHIKAYL